MDHAIHRRGNTKLAYSAVGFGNLHSLNRLGTIRSREKLAGDTVAVTLEILFELCHTHPVHTGGSAVGNDFRHCDVKVFGVADGLHQPVTTCRAFGRRVRRGQYGPFFAGPRRFTPTLLREGQQQLLL